MTAELTRDEESMLRFIGSATDGRTSVDEMHAYCKDDEGRYLKLLESLEDRGMIGALLYHDGFRYVLTMSGLEWRAFERIKKPLYVN